ncbi:hypothetical protein GCM10007885_04420 [Methylobacterium gnaphalii]|nr:hypothetical protein GCM10007885_04420 [Methylobacterium gnaphalii]
MLSAASTRRRRARKEVPRNFLGMGASCEMGARHRGVLSDRSKALESIVTQNRPAPLTTARNRGTPGKRMCL